MKADKLLEKFKKVLRIEDWDITLSVLPDDEYQKKHGKDFAFDTDGCTEILSDGRTAHIYLKASIQGDNLVTTLLHECVHLVTHPYDSFVRETLTYVDSKKIAKKFKNDAMWEMEIQVARFTTIIKGLL